MTNSLPSSATTFVIRVERRDFDTVGVALANPEALGRAGRDLDTLKPESAQTVFCVDALRLSDEAARSEGASEGVLGRIDRIKEGSLLAQLQAAHRGCSEALLIVNQVGAGERDVPPPISAINAGIDIVLVQAKGGIPTVDFIQGQAVVRLAQYRGNSVETWVPNPVLLNTTDEGLQLRLYGWLDAHGAPRKANEDEGPLLYADALRTTNDAEMFLEHVDLEEDSRGSYLALRLTTTGRVPATRPGRRWLQAPWNSEPESSFDADPAYRINSLVISHELKRRGIAVEWINSGFLIAKHKGREISFHVTSTPHTSQTAAKAVGDKGVGRAILAASGLSVAEGTVFRSRAEWARAIELLSPAGSLVIKPVDGTKGRGVTVNVRTHDAFNAAWTSAFEVSPSGVLVEKYFQGTEARFFVVNGTCLAVARRIPPAVVGDGSSSIRALINAKNRSRRQNPHLTNRPVVLDVARLARMAEHGLTPMSVLPAGREFVIDYKGGFSTGAESVDVTDEVHPSYREVATKAVAAIPGLTISGVDIMARDFAQPATGDNHIIVELNSQPGLGGHHFPVHGVSRDVAGPIVDMALNPPPRKVALVSGLESRSQFEVGDGYDDNALLLAGEFERLGFEVVWIQRGYFIAQRGERVTTVWGSYTHLTGKVAVSATRHTRIAQRLLQRQGIPVPHGRIYSADRPEGAFVNGQRALKFAATLKTATLRSGTRNPIRVNADDPDGFRAAWSRMSALQVGGILVERPRRGSSYRFLVANGHTLSVIRRRRAKLPVSVFEEMHPSYHEAARGAVAAFPGLDLGEVTLVIQDPSAEAGKGDYVVTSVRAGPSLVQHARAVGNDRRAVAQAIVTRHLEHLY